MPYTVPSQPVTVLASAARTTTATSDAFDGADQLYRGILIVMNTTALSATPSVVPKVQTSTQGIDWTDHLAGSAMTTANATQLLLIHPDGPDRANIAENTALSYKWRVVCTAGDADSLTYSVTAYYLQ